MDHDRLEQHRKPDALETGLRYFERLLGPLERREIERVALCDEPILYLMGCARSGSTLVHQYLSQSGLFTFPTNFISRFHYAPYLGARLQEMLFAADFRGEITGGPGDACFASDLGKTQGPLSPHEFWYFWRRFADFGDEQKLTPRGIAAFDGATFIRELRAFQSVSARPLVLKGMILNWDIPLLAGQYERSYFLFVHRRLEANADSLVRARRRFFGDERRWYSFKPPGYADVLELDPYRQTAWQVVCTNSAVEAGLATLPEDRVFRVGYEAFCERPQILLQAICDRWRRHVPANAGGLPPNFAVREEFRNAPVDWSEVIASVREFIARRAAQGDG